MSELNFASLIQRAYRIIGSSDDPCQMLESLCKLLASESEFVFVWIEPYEQKLKKNKICFAKEGYFGKHDKRLIIQHFNECSLLKDDRNKNGIHRISSEKNDRCFNLIKTYFPENKCAAIFSFTIQHGQTLFAYLNIFSTDANRISDDKFSLLKELTNDIAIKIFELSGENNSKLQPNAESPESKDYLKRLLHCMYEDIIVIDRNYNIVDVNNSRLKISDKKIEDVIGAKCYAATHGFDKPCELYNEECLIQEVFKTG